MKNLAIAFLLTAAVMVASSANAQAYVGYMPAAPAVSYYAPAPVATYYSPVIATAYYAPQTVYYSAPAPYYVAAPVFAPAPAVVAPVAVAPVYARPVIVRTKIYVPGQPVRNVLRAVTP
jgi:hypothetical protein